ncbi:carbohydrate ABC transporter permease [Lachnospiraceae bacterium KGMB03038]|nr:carbohydrate ABC transporter permease [Lachnospiraceae bacterium KGMB03038]
MKYVEKYVGGLILLIVIAVSILPFIYMLIMSFKDTLSAYNFNLDGLTPENYVKIFHTAEFGRYFFNSAFVALAGVVLAVVVSCLAGYAFAKLKFPGNDLIFFLLIMTLIIPSEVIIVPLYLIMKNLDWLNTYQALILPLPTALGTFIMRQAILAVPNELLDAAKIEGCSNTRILWKIIIPLIKPSILTLSIFTFVGAWNNFLWPLVVSTESEMMTLPLILSTTKTQFEPNIGLTMACAAVNFLPPFIFYILLQSKFKEGVVLTGMKG